jgi:hypothetical protein
MTRVFVGLRDPPAVADASVEEAAEKAAEKAALPPSNGSPADPPPDDESHAERSEDPGAQPKIEVVRR